MPRPSMILVPVKILSYVNCFHYAGKQAKAASAGPKRYAQSFCTSINPNPLSFLFFLEHLDGLQVTQWPKTISGL